MYERLASSGRRRLGRANGRADLLAKLVQNPARQKIKFRATTLENLENLGSGHLRVTGARSGTALGPGDWRQQPWTWKTTKGEAPTLLIQRTA